MNLERVSWSAGIASAVLALAALAWTVWQDVGATQKASVDPPATGFIDASRQPGLSRRLVGLWKCVTTHSSPDGSIVSSGYLQLIETGQYQFSGDMLFHLPKNQQVSSLSVTALATGTWQTHDNTFTVTLGDLKSTARSVSAFPIKLEDVIPKGSSQNYSILEISDTRLRAAGTDIRGNSVLLEATRE